MKKDYKNLALVATFVLGSFSGFSQESPKKPVEKVKVFQGTEQPFLANSRQILDDQLELPKGNTMQIVSEKTDRLGYSHWEYQQYFKGVKVEFATSVLNAKNGKLISMANNVFRISDLSTVPSISAGFAFKNALSFVDAKAYLWEDKKEMHLLESYSKPVGELVVLPPLKGISTQARLAYKFDIYAVNPISRADVYIDAHTGKFLMENARIHHRGTSKMMECSEKNEVALRRFPAEKAFYTNVSASGSSLYNGTVSFTADSYGGNYRLAQTSYGNGVHTYDLNNGTNYTSATEIISGSTSFSHSTGVQAHWGAEQTYQYFYQNHNRNSYNNAGGEILSYVSYSTGFVNAYWDGSRMTYGDGDGVNYGPLVSLDIVGHELSHGVTEYAAGLVYQRESGALNESFSDIFGESIENFASGSNDWLMGDEIGAGGSGGALRSMSNPNAYSQPDTYGGQYWQNPNCGTPTRYNDYCGVHTNSGVQNYWFYLLSMGGSGTNDQGNSYTVSAIGMNNAAAIAYRNLNVYMNSNSDYDDARSGAIQSAIELYGADSAEEIAVTNAWYAVGVGSEYDDGTTPPPSGECIVGDVHLSLTFDNYPEETGWTLKDSSGTLIDSETYSSSNADGSTINVSFSTLAADDYTFTITDQYGDGICCSYGSGSYTLSSDTGVIFSGGSFGNSESTAFCIEGGSTPPPSNDYCESNGNNSSYEWIDLVTLNNMNHSSGNDGGYADNTNLTANLAYGSNTMNISAGFSSSGYTEYWKIWIDYNQNGIFDAAELALSGSSSSSATLSGTFTVPSSALAGTTRMRVSMKYNSAQTPCESFNYGEVEDYSVNIGQGVNPINSINGITLGNDLAIFSASIYPNPVSGDFLNIEMGDDREISYIIHDLTGRKVAEGNFKSSSAVNVGTLSSGVYLVEISDGQKQFIEKFIKE